MDAERPAPLADRRLGRVAQRRELAVGESHALHAAEVRRVGVRQPDEPAFRLEQLRELPEEPGIDSRGLGDDLDGQPRRERPLDLEDPLRRRLP
jgi:hypothetical protein